MAIFFIFFNSVAEKLVQAFWSLESSKTEKVFDLIEEALVATMHIMDSGVQKKLFVSTFNCHTDYVRMC